MTRRMKFTFFLPLFIALLGNQAWGGCEIAYRMSNSVLKREQVEKLPLSAEEITRVVKQMNWGGEVQYTLPENQDFNYQFPDPVIGSYIQFTYAKKQCGEFKADSRQFRPIGGYTHEGNTSVLLAIKAANNTFNLLVQIPAGYSFTLFRTGGTSPQPTTDPVTEKQWASDTLSVTLFAKLLVAQANASAKKNNDLGKSFGAFKPHADEFSELATRLSNFAKTGASHNNPLTKKLAMKVANGYVELLSHWDEIEAVPSSVNQTWNSLGEAILRLSEYYPETRSEE